MDELPNTLSQETVWEAGTGKFFYGREAVDEWRRAHPGGEDGVVVSAKLAMHIGFQDRDTVKEVWRNLGLAVGNDQPNLLGLQKELTRQFEFIREATLRSAIEHSNEYLCDAEPPDFRSLEHELQLAVPVVWTSEARGAMKQAALTAGYTSVHIREEPLCVASSLVQDTRERGPQLTAKVLLLDIGSGTSDATMLHFTETGTVSISCNKEGGTCGSSLTNELAWRHFREENADSPLYRERLGQRSKALGIPESDVRRQFFRGFDGQKIRYNQNESKFAIMIEGVHGVDPDTILHFDRTLMTVWFDRWADENVRVVKRLLKKSSKDRRGPACGMAVLAGGGSRSRHMHRKLKDVLAADGIQCMPLESSIKSCCEGALMTFNSESAKVSEQGQVYLIDTARGDVASACVDNFFDTERYKHQILVRLGSFDSKGLKAGAPARRLFEIEHQGRGVRAAVHVEICIDDAPRSLPAGAPLLDEDCLRPNLEKLPVRFFELPDLAAAGFVRHPRFCGKGMSGPCSDCKDEYSAVELAERPSFWRVFGAVSLVEIAGAVAVKLTILNSAFTLRKATMKVGKARHGKAKNGPLAKAFWSAEDEFHTATQALRHMVSEQTLLEASADAGHTSQNLDAVIQLKRTQSRAFSDRSITIERDEPTPSHDYERNLDVSSSHSNIVTSPVALEAPSTSMSGMPTGHRGPPASAGSVSTRPTPTVAKRLSKTPKRARHLPVGTERA